jgi:hypothetical protein
MQNLVQTAPVPVPQIAGHPASPKTLAWPLAAPRGTAFAIPELLLIQAWADFHGFRMEVRYDHQADGDVFEEVLSVSALDNPAERFLIWREADLVHVQPIFGGRRGYESVADALDGLAAADALVVTDITAARWPDA